MRNPLSIDSVQQCRECVTLGVDHVPSSGDPNAHLMLIGRDPGAVEVEVGKPFVGPSGDLINYLLDDVGIHREDTYIANAVKCHTPNNRGPHREELEMCWNRWLFEEIKHVNPEVIVVFGKDAYGIVIQNRFPFQHLSVVKSKKRSYIISWHPGYILRMGTMDRWIPELAAVIKSTLEEAGVVI